MRIRTVEGCNLDVAIESLLPGDCFKYDGQYACIVEPDENMIDPRKEVMIVWLENMAVQTMMLGTEVKPVFAEVIIKK